MSLDFPASGAALWSLFDRGGPRPEYVLPVLYSESGFSTSITNDIGCVGLNQLCPPNVPDGYASWSASQQIAGSVAPYMMALVARYGPLRSGTRVYQANFLPATLPTARTLASTLAVRGSAADVCSGCHLSQAAVYAANPGLDWQRKGSIVLGDLAHFIARAAAAAPVQSAIAQTYALRPGDRPHDPVYGEDCGAGILELVAYGTAILGAGAALALALRRWRLRRAA